MQEVEFKGRRWLELCMLFFAAALILGFVMNVFSSPIGDLLPSLSQILLAIGFYLFTAANNEHLKKYPKSLSLARVIVGILLGVGLLNFGIVWFQSFVLPPLPPISRYYELALEFANFEQFKEAVREILNTSNSLLISNCALLIPSCLFLVASKLFDRWIRQVILGEEIDAEPSDELSPAMFWIALIEFISVVITIITLFAITQIFSAILTIEDITVIPLSVVNSIKTHLGFLELLNIIYIGLLLFNIGLRIAFFITTIMIFRELSFQTSWKLS
ncbi:MAG: hypothetical protein ACFFBD_08895 [Candidatus Hodarchaeota archaeon]